MYGRYALASMFTVVLIAFLGYSIFALTVSEQNREKEISDLRAAEIVAELDVMTGKVSSFDKDLSGRDERIRVLSEENLLLSERVSDLEGRLLELEASGSAEAEALRVEISELSDLLKEKEATLLSVLSDRDALVAEVGSLTTQIDSLVFELNSGNKLFSDVVSGRVTSLSSFDLAGITEIRPYAFYGCKALEAVYLPDTVVSVGKNAFYGCTSLVEFVFESDKISSLGDSLFVDCSSLKNVRLPASLTYIPENMFMGCSSLTKLVLPSSLKRIPNYTAFKRCVALEYIEFSGSDELTLYGNVFGDCVSLREVVIRSASVAKLTFSTTFSIPGSCLIYVRDGLVSGYKTSNFFKSFGDRILPISDLVESEVVSE